MIAAPLVGVGRGYGFAIARNQARPRYGLAAPVKDMQCSYATYRIALQKVGALPRS